MLHPFVSLIARTRSAAPSPWLETAPEPSTRVLPRGPAPRGRTVLTLLVMLALGACISARRPDQVEELLGQALRAAEAHHEFELDPEAAVILDAIAEVDDGFPGLQELNEDLDPDARIGVVRGRFGMNYKQRPPLERSARARAWLWLPDRIFDLLDIVTVGAHFGVGAFSDAHLTRAFQVAGGLRSTGGVGLHDHRSLGMKSQAEAGLTFVAVGSYTYAGSLVGTTGTRSVSDTAYGLHQPFSPLYQELRDYWAVGGSGTAGIVGFEADFHPLQLADFFAGLVGVDLLNDDLAHTRSLKLDGVERKLVAELQRLRWAPRILAAYHEAKQAGTLASSERVPATSEPGEGSPSDWTPVTPDSDPLPPQETVPAAPQPDPPPSPGSAPW
ncbi:MAG: hypothetical protein ACE5FG_06310 [Myxococcota bacterium]